MPFSFFQRRPSRDSPQTYRLFFRKWPKISRKATWWLMPFELAGTVSALVIFGISQPDLWRSEMWQIGWDHRLNSNPAIVLYAYSNHVPQPHLALIWTRTFTNFNVAIAVLSLFMMMAKLTAFIMKVWYPIVGTFISLGMTALYTTSVYGLIGPDMVDKRYPAHVAWYWRKGCGLAKPYGSYGHCRIAQGSLVVAVYLMVVYAVNLGFAAYGLLPNKTNDELSDDEEEYSDRSEPKDTQRWEMGSMRSPVFQQTPYTPRTQAFHTLDRQLPLRSQQTRYS
ncbi:hypothetical protein BGZ63DRAFT_345364 [Mariannaea sp. PMI_226]|nr:hypothetical protein BGZ63DRAFT_345364 [Mariannaea sp. PMI_226]